MYWGSYHLVGTDSHYLRFTHTENMYRKQCIGVLITWWALTHTTYKSLTLKTNTESNVLGFLSLGGHWLTLPTHRSHWKQVQKAMYWGSYHWVGTDSHYLQSTHTENKYRKQCIEVLTLSGHWLTLYLQSTHTENKFRNQCIGVLTLSGHRLTLPTIHSHWKQVQKAMYWGSYT